MKKYNIISLLIVILMCTQVGINPSLNAQNTSTTPRLFIGGGGFSEGMYLEFCKMIGPDAKLIVIPTATSREVKVEAIQKRWQDRGIQNVSVLHTRDREVAKSFGFTDKLKLATAVWISGGSQSRIADAYLDTPVEEELYKLLQRGGIIGGSSAGAAIQTRTMIQGGRTEPDISIGFNLLEGAILDQHFLKRNRLTRLITAVKAYPNLVGFGIDEDTAIVVNGAEAKVLGNSYVIRIEMVNGAVQIDAFEDEDEISLAKQ